MEWTVTVCCESLDERPARLTGKFDTFDDVLNCLDILNDYYIIQSVLITRKPKDSEVYDEL